MKNFALFLTILLAIISCKSSLPSKGDSIYYKQYFSLDEKIDEGGSPRKYYWVFNFDKKVVRILLANLNESCQYRRNRIIAISPMYNKDDSLKFDFVFKYRNGLKSNTRIICKSSGDSLFVNWYQTGAGKNKSYHYLGNWLFLKCK